MPTKVPLPLCSSLSLCLWDSSLLFSLSVSLGFLSALGLCVSVEFPSALVSVSVSEVVSKIL